MKCMLIGSGGRLGRELHLRYRRLMETVPYDRALLDITEKEKVYATIEKEKPGFIVNAAAWTDVTGAEIHEEKVHSVNAEGVGNLAEASRAFGIPLIHFSTDYVFSGEGERPWAETDRVDPCGVYGLSKARGEALFRDCGARGAVIRLGWLHSGERDFVSAILRKALSGESLRVVANQWGTPSYAGALAAWTVSATPFLLGTKDFSLIHYVEKGGYISRFEMAAYLLETAARRFHQKTEYEKADLCLEARRTMRPSLLCDGIRPKNCRLRCTREGLPGTECWTEGVDKSVEKVIEGF